MVKVCFSDQRTGASADPDTRRGFLIEAGPIQRIATRQYLADTSQHVTFPALFCAKLPPKGKKAKERLARALPSFGLAPWEVRQNQLS